MLRIILLSGLIVLICVGVTSCDKRGKAKKISLGKKAAVEEKAKPPEEKPLRIAVGAMITPKAGFAYYHQLLKYIEGKLKTPVRFVDRGSYAEVNKLMRTGDIDVAFVCGRPYIHGHDEFGMELQVASQVHGETVYYSYVIVSKDSPIERFEGLRGKSFAFTDPLSNTGMLAPTYMLAGMGETPGSFFQKYIYTYAHDKSIRAVAQGIVDGAAVDHLIWEYLSRTNPEITSKIKVIEKSPPYGIPPVVVRPGLDPELKERIKQIFLNAHKNERGREILKGMMIDRFVTVDDGAYDSTREMKAWIDKPKAEE